MSSKNCYALYKGDEFIDLGSLKYLSEKYNISERSLICYGCPSHWNRRNQYNNARILIKILD